MSITKLIVHEIQKREGESRATLVARPSENPVDAQVEALSQQITGLFNRSGMNTGRFSNPDGSEGGSRLPVLLKQHFVDNTFPRFSEFSKDCAMEFIRFMEPVDEAQGGLLWLSHYELHDTQFLFIALLKRKSGVVLDTDLSLTAVDQIELDKLHLAMRVNLTAWADQDESRYISFRFGRAPKNESDYFTAFIGCNEPVAAAKETRKLVDLTASFCQQAGVEKQAASEFRKAVAEHCLEKYEEKEPVELNYLANQVKERFSPEQANAFLNMAQSESFAMEREVFVEKAALKRLTRLSGSSRALTLSFDSDLLGSSIQFDAKSETLIIQDIPKTLLKQLKEQAD